MSSMDAYLLSRRDTAGGITGGGASVGSGHASGSRRCRSSAATTGRNLNSGGKSGANGGTNGGTNSGRTRNERARRPLREASARLNANANTSANNGSTSKRYEYGAFTVLAGADTPNSLQSASTAATAGTPGSAAMMASIGSIDERSVVSELSVHSAVSAGWTRVVTASSRRTRRRRKDGKSGRKSGTVMIPLDDASVDLSCDLSAHAPAVRAGGGSNDISTQDGMAKDLVSADTSGDANGAASSAASDAIAMEGAADQNTGNTADDADDADGSGDDDGAKDDVRGGADKENAFKMGHVQQKQQQRDQKQHKKHKQQKQVQKTSDGEDEDGKKKKTRGLEANDTANEEKEEQQEDRANKCTGNKDMKKKKKKNKTTIRPVFGELKNFRDVDPKKSIRVGTTKSGNFIKSHEGTTGSIGTSTAAVGDREKDPAVPAVTAAAAAAAPAAATTTVTTTTTEKKSAPPVLPAPVPVPVPSSVVGGQDYDIHPTTLRYLETKTAAEYIIVNGGEAESNDDDDDDDETEDHQHQHQQEQHLTPSLEKIIDQASRIETEIMDEILTIQTTLGVAGGRMMPPSVAAAKGSPHPGTGTTTVDVPPPTSLECDGDAASLVSELPTTLTAADANVNVNVLTTVTGRVVYPGGLVETEEDLVIVEKVLDDIDPQGCAEENKEKKRAQVHATQTLLATFCLSLAVALGTMTLPTVPGGGMGEMKFVGTSSFIHRIAPLRQGVLVPAESNPEDSPTSTSEKENGNAAMDRAAQYAKRKGLVSTSSQGDNAMVGTKQKPKVEHIPFEVNLPEDYGRNFWTNKAIARRDEERGLDFLHEDDSVAAPRNVDEWIEARRTGSACFQPKGVLSPNIEVALRSSGCDVNLQDVLTVYNYPDVSKTTITSITRSQSEVQASRGAKVRSIRNTMSEYNERIDHVRMPYSGTGSRPAFLFASTAVSSVGLPANLRQDSNAKFLHLTTLWDAQQYGKASISPGAIKSETSRMVRSLVSTHVRMQLSDAAAQPPSAKIELSVPEIALLFDE